MGLHTRQQFADLAGVTEKYLNVYISRKKVIVREDKYIDDENELNKYFLAKREGKKTPVEKKDGPKKPKPETPKVEQKKRRGRSLDPGEDDPFYVRPGSLMDIELQQKKSQLQKTQLDVELKEIDRKKKMGLLIPVDLVTVTMKVHNKSILESFNNAAENLSAVVLKRLGASRADRSEFKSKLTDHINKAIEEAAAETKREIKKIVDRYKETRERGERKN